MGLGGFFLNLDRNVPKHSVNETISIVCQPTVTKPSAGGAGQKKTKQFQIHLVGSRVRVEDAPLWFNSIGKFLGIAGLELVVLSCPTLSALTALSRVSVRDEMWRGSVRSESEIKPNV